MSDFVVQDDNYQIILDQEDLIFGLENDSISIVENEIGISLTDLQVLDNFGGN